MSPRLICSGLTLGLLLPAAGFAHAAVALPEFDGATPIEWSARLAKSEMARRGESLAFHEGGKARWDYTTGIFCLSLLKLADAAKPDLYSAYAANVIGSYIAPDGSIRTYSKSEYNLDNIASGRPVLALYKKTGDKRYQLAADELRNQLVTQPRTRDGGFWHKQKYPEQMWLDGLYMASPFLAHYSKVFNQPANFTEVAHQLILADHHLYDADKRLYHHGWDESHAQGWANPKTGTSPSFWARAEGWYAMALVDTLDVMPADQPERGELQTILNRVLHGLTEYQDAKSGVWYQVLDQGNRPGNYLEATASSMYVYAFAKAANHHWIDVAWARPIVLHAYEGVLKEFVRQDGADRWSLIRCCSVAGLGANRDGTFNYYIHEPVVANDLKGIGPFIVAGIELQKFLGEAPDARGPTPSASSSEEPAEWKSVPALLARIQAPHFRDEIFDITAFGAKADGSLCTAAIARAIDAAAAAGGGHVRVPAGTFITGAIHLRSGVDLHLERDATLQFSTNPEDYLPMVLTRSECIECYNYSPPIYALDQENIGLTGEGTIDAAASDDNWWSWTKRGTGREREDEKTLVAEGEHRSPVEERRFGAGHFLRPVFVQPYRCRNVVIEGIHIRRSPMWELNPVLCKNVVVRHVDISSHGPNNDGCDPECSEDVLIEDCTFDTGDDCIAIKSGRNEDGRRVGRPSKNIVIRNCTMREGHGGVVLGSEVSGGIQNIFVEHCTMDSPTLDRMLRLKSNAQRGGVIENIFVRDIKVGRVAEAIVTVDFQYEEGAHGDHPPVARHIVVDRVTSQSSPRVLFIAGIETGTIDDLTISNSHFQNVEQADLVEHAGRITFDHVMIESAKKARSLNSRL